LLCQIRRCTCVVGPSTWCSSHPPILCQPNKTYCKTCCTLCTPQTSGVSKIRICVLCGCPVSADVLLSPAHVIQGDANTDHGHDTDQSGKLFSASTIILVWGSAGPSSCSTNTCVQDESSTCDVACQHVRNVWWVMYVLVPCTIHCIVITQAACCMGCMWSQTAHCANQQHYNENAHMQHQLHTC
jgi:hypothetical protein